MINVEELKKKFPVKNVVPYGQCVIVPGSEFNPDWEAELEDQGISIIEADFGDPGKPVTLVQIRRKEKGPETAHVTNDQKLKGPTANLHIKVWSEDDEKKLLKRMTELPGTVEEKCLGLASEFVGRSPAAIHQKYVKLQRKLKALGVRTPRLMDSAHQGWSDDENALVIALWNKNLKLLDVADKLREKYPDRTVQAVKMRLARLRETEKIKSRWTRKVVEERKGPVGSEPASTPVHTPIPTPIPTLETPAESDSEVLELLTEIRDLLLPPSFSFESYCPGCHERRSEMEEERVWLVCPQCDCKLIVWNVEVSV